MEDSRIANERTAFDKWADETEMSGIPRECAWAGWRARAGLPLPRLVPEKWVKEAKIKDWPT